MKKKIIIWLLLTLSIYTVSFPRVLIANNSSNRPIGHYQLIQDAVTAANNGDTIYVVGSPTTYGSINLFFTNKALVFIGAGYRPQKDFNYSSKIDDINAATTSSVNGNNIKVLGFEIFGSIGKTGTLSCCGGNNWEIAYNKFTGSNAQIVAGDNCNIHDNFFEVPPNFGASPITSILFDGNAPCLIHNNMFSRQIGTNGVLIADKKSVPFNSTGNMIYNNHFLSASGGNVFGNIYSSTIKNNLFYGYRIADTNVLAKPQTCIFNNNLTNYSFNVFGNNTSNSSNYFGQLQLSHFQNPNLALNGAFDFPPYNYSLQTSSVGHNAGTDNTDIGAFGGANPFNNFTGMQNMPVVKKLDIFNSIIGVNDSLQLHLIATSISSNLSAAEYFFDTDPGHGNGIPIPITSVDSTNSILNISHGLPIGNHFIGYRVRNINGVWSIPDIRSFRVCTISGSLAGFNYYVNGRDVIFENTSINQQSCHWDFGDGDTSIQSNPVHYYDSAGVFNTRLISKNVCLQFGDTISKTIVINGINSITPNKGGNSGLVSCYIQGTGFTNNAIVKLFKTGYNDIYAIDTLSSLLNSQLYLATFDLMNRDTGKWNVSVTIPQDTIYTLMNAFQIEYPIADSFQIEFLAPFSARYQSIYPIQIKYSNQSNVNIKAPFFSLISLDTVPIAFDKGQLTKKYKELPLFLTNREFNSQFLNNDSGRISNLNFLSPGIINTITIWAKGSFSSFSKFALINNNKDEDIGNRSNSSWGGDCSIVPDLVFTTACQNHDNCYGTCGSNKLECDLVFYSDMLKACDANYEIGSCPWVRCIKNAANYYQGVRIFGYYFWGLAQLSCSPPPPQYTPPPNVLRNQADCPCGADCEKVLNVGSQDPNYKLGNLILEHSIFQNSHKSLNYTIHFENVDTATASAQSVVIKDTLDNTNLDLSTLYLNSIGFADTIITIPPGRQSFTTDVDMRPGIPLICRVSAFLNTSTHTLTTKFESLDPITMELTDSVLLGFLPPNDSTGRGEGFISYSIKAKTGIATGTVINNKAHIYFDENLPIATPTWTNIIDDLKPQSQVNPLPGLSISDSVIVTWSGTDNGPAGIYAYNVYYKVNNGNWLLWKYNTSLTSDTYVGKTDSTYSFYSIAIDSALNVEPAPASFDAITTVKICNTLAQPGNITGNVSVPNRQTTSYSIPSVSGAAKYFWSLSGGGSILSGEDSTIVSIKWSAQGNFILSVVAINDCDTSSARNISVNVSPATGIVNPDNRFEVEISPNPSTGEFYLTAKGVANKSIRLEVLSIDGRQISIAKEKARSGDFNHTLNLKHFANGVYIVKISIDNKVYVRKITKQ